MTSPRRRLSRIPHPTGTARADRATLGLRTCRGSAAELRQALVSACRKQTQRTRRLPTGVPVRRRAPCPGDRTKREPLRVHVTYSGCEHNGIDDGTTLRAGDA